MIDAYSLDQRFARLNRAVRRAHVLAAVTLVFGAAMLWLHLRSPSSLSIGAVTISGDRIVVRGTDRVTTIGPYGVSVREGDRVLGLGPAELTMRTQNGGGAHVDFWASGTSMMFALTNARSDAGWMTSISPDGVTELVRGHTVDQRVEKQ